MRDDYYCLSVGLHVPEDREEFFRFLRGKNGSWFIEDEDVGSPVEDLYDLDGLLLGNGHVVDLHRGIDVKTVLRTDFLNLVVGVFDIHLLFGKTENDVLGRREDVNKVVMLVNHSNAVGKRILGGCYRNLSAVREDFTLIRLINAGQHVHERGLATAVLAEEREYFTPFYFKVDAVVGNNLSKPFGYALKFDRTAVLHLDPLR